MEEIEIFDTFSEPYDDDYHLDDMSTESAGKIEALPIEPDNYAVRSIRSKTKKGPTLGLRCHDESGIEKYFDLTCNECTDKAITFRNCAEDRLHYKTVHQKFNKCHGVCRLCKMSKTSASKMREHIRFHEEPANFNCSFCSKVLYSQYSLRQHELIHEVTDVNPANADLFECDICGKKAGLGIYRYCVLIED